MTQIVSVEEVEKFVVDLLNPIMHMKRARSISRAVFGTMNCDRLSSVGIGTALSLSMGTFAKHGIKQVDRLLGNHKFDTESCFRVFVPWIVGCRPEIVVSLDWTEYASDGHSRIAINLVTDHGRATPLIWKTHETRYLKSYRNALEDKLLLLLASILPAKMGVTVLADRGFGDEKLYEFISKDLGWNYIIRFRGGITVEAGNGDLRKAKDWVPSNGRIKEVLGAKVTKNGAQVGAVVVVKRKMMKNAWHLATSFKGQSSRVVQLYGRRFTCEETFRDEKDIRFGLGFKQTRVSTCERRDRFLFIAALATALLTLLGAAGEKLELDRKFKTNTAKRRIHSLFRQGRMYIRDIIGKHVKRLRDLFLEFVSRQPFSTVVFGQI